MTIEQFVVASIIIFAVTALSVWHFMFIPRLREVEESSAKWQARAEVAEDTIRTSDAEGMNLVGNHDWGGPLDFLSDEEYGK